MNAIETGRRIDMQDPRALLIVTEAAMEFDRAANGMETKFASTRLLVGALKDWLPKPATIGGSAAQFDIGTVGVMSRALPGADGHRISDVVKRSWEMAEKLGNTGSSATSEQLVECRHFCVKLGHSLLSYRALEEKYRPTNPYRM